MMTRFILLLIYLGSATAGFFLAWLFVLKTGAFSWGEVGLWVSAGALLLLASCALTVLIANFFFPIYWWLGQALGKDIYEFDGVYFSGLRLSRIPGRLQRIVYGVDEKMRRWDMLFGLLMLTLFVPHVLAAVTLQRLERPGTNIVEFLPEALHYEVLSALPILVRWHTPWSPRNALQDLVEAAVSAPPPAAQNPETWFYLAQLNLLHAFRERKGWLEPFRRSPGERAYFDRTRATKALNFLNRIVNNRPSVDPSLNQGALALIGFFYLSDSNPARAVDFLELALAGEIGARPQLPRYHLMLMAAQANFAAGNPARAQVLLQNLLGEQKLPTAAYGMALELLSEMLLSQGNPKRSLDFLRRAEKRYKKDEHRGGIARVHLRLAALALEQGRLLDARRELSHASSLSTGLEDWFTANMVEQLTLKFPTSG